MPSKRRHMIWILIGVLISYLLVNSPLIYSLLHVHKLKGIGKLWGYAPNQFLFLVLFFPFAAFATLSALRLFILKIYPTLPVTSWLNPVVDHWPVSLLVGLIVAALFTILIYFTSGWSFDKLHPDYARTALESAAGFENKVEESSKVKEEQEAYRKQLIRKSKQDLEALTLPTQRDDAQISQWIHALQPELYLQVVQNRSLPHRLRLLHPAIHALNVFQLFIVLFIGSIAMFIAGVCIYYGYEADYSGTNLPELKPTIEAVFWAIFFFSFYVICYHQYRSQVEELVGSGTTVLQDVLVGIIIGAVLIGIRLIDPNNRILSVLTVLRFLPIAVFASGVIVEETLPHITRQLIGNETTLGFQVAFSAIFTAFAMIPTVRLALLE